MSSRSRAVVALLPLVFLGACVSSSPYEPAPSRAVTWTLDLERTPEDGFDCAWAHMEPNGWTIKQVRWERLTLDAWRTGMADGSPALDTLHLAVVPSQDGLTGRMTVATHRGPSTNPGPRLPDVDRTLAALETCR